MNKKSGSAVSLVPPIAPKDPAQAVEGETGQVTTAASESVSRSGALAEARPFRPPETAEEQQQHPGWIEIKLLDEEDNPVPGARYQIKLPDGTCAEGTLDGDGYARVEGFDPGSCEVTFPDLDTTCWEAS